MAKVDQQDSVRDRRRTDIADAARALIAQHGLEGLRTRDIAAKAGINIATMHYHVPNKEALVELVAESLRDQFIAQHNSRSRVGLSALELLQIEFADFRDTRIHNPDLHMVLAELFEKSRRDPAIAAAVRPMQVFWHEQIAAILERGAAEGKFRSNVDPKAGATIVIGALIGSMKQPDAGLAHYDRVTAEIERSLLKPQ